MAKEKDVIIANHHSAPIVLARIYAPNLKGDPADMRLNFEQVHIPSGGTATLTATEWEERKKQPSVQYYLDQGYLSQVRRAGTAEVTGDSTLDLEVPEHLQVDQEGAVTVDSATGDGTVKAKITKATKSTTTVGA